MAKFKCLFLRGADQDGAGSAVFVELRQDCSYGAGWAEWERMRVLFAREVGEDGKFFLYRVDSWGLWVVRNMVLYHHSIQGPIFPNFHNLTNLDFHIAIISTLPPQSPPSLRHPPEKNTPSTHSPNTDFTKTPIHLAQLPPPQLSLKPNHHNYPAPHPSLKEKQEYKNNSKSLFFFSSLVFLCHFSYLTEKSSQPLKRKEKTGMKKKESKKRGSVSVFF